MSRLPEKIIFGLVGLIITGWLGYHIFYRYYQPMEVETVFEYTLADTLSAKGIAIRDETVMSRSGAGIANYLFEDAERVTIGQTVVEYYDSLGSDRSIKRMRELEREIEMLKNAQNKQINNFANTDNLNRDIRDQLSRLTELTDVGQLSGTQQVKWNMVSLLNRRQIATGKAEDFAARISFLEAEYKRLEESAAIRGMTSSQAPVSGYFVKSVDGYEKYIDTNTIGEYGIDDYSRLIRNGADISATESSGKIITNHNWYFAVSLKKSNTETLREGQSAELEFIDTGERAPVVIYEILEEKDNDDAVILFHCNRLSSDLINLRVQDVVIHFVQYTGLRISASSLYFEDGVRGVYVIVDNIVRFKEVVPIYEESTFILSEMNVIETPGYNVNQVRLYNQVIARGTDLYDGKALQEDR